MSSRARGLGPAPRSEKDFKEVVAFLRSKGIMPQAGSRDRLASARKMHAATYSLILWRFRIMGLPERARVFLHEIASDALQVLPQALMGYRKTTTLLIRSIAENVLRHIYFADHPVEFERANREKRWYLGALGLFEYLRHHPKFVEAERNFDGISRLKTLYDELSAGVHGRKVTHLEMRRSLRGIVFEQEQFDGQVKLIWRCAEASNFLLLVFHNHRVTRFPKQSQQIILRTIPPKARRVWRGLT